MSRKNLITNSVISFLAVGVRGAGTLLIGLLLANGFSVQEFGDFRFFQISVTMLATLAAPGMSVTASKYFAKTQAENSTETQPIIHLWIVSLAFAAITALACLVTPLANFVSTSNDHRWLLAMIVFLTAANLLPSGALVGLSLFSRALAVEVFALIVFVGGTGIAIWQHDLSIAYWAMLCSALASLTANSAIILAKENPRDLINSLVSTRFWQAITNVLSTFGWLTVIAISMAALFWMTAWIIKNFNNDPLAFARYSIGLQWFFIANLVATVLGRVAFPQAVQGASKNDATNRDNRALLWLTLKAALFSSSAVAISVLIFSPVIIWFYGANYAGSGLVLAAFAAAAIPYGMANMIGYFIVAHDGEKTWAAVSVLQLAVTLLVAYLVLPAKEMAGPAALFAGSLCALIFSVFLARRKVLI